jgi:flagellar biosynthesis GTPase FlhF
MQATRAIAQKQQEIVSLKNAQKQQSEYAQAAQQAAAKYTNLSAQQQARMAQSPIARNARARVQYKNQQQEHISAKEMKDKAIQKALRDVATMQQEQEEYQPKRRFWQKRGFLISGAVAIISIALLGYLVYLNLPDLSVRVAAMQTGIENAYPSYVPMNYRLSGLVKEDNGAITMNFVQENGGSFQLIEKKSSWDSATVLSNFVEEKWGSNYVVAKGQGLTVYISGSNAVWVNGGVLYQIEDHGSNLTTDDLHDIAISL